MAKGKMEEFIGIGRRKTAVARVRISKGDNKWFVNGKELVRSDLSDDLNSSLMKPLRTVALEEGIYLRAYVQGGGFVGQMGAIVLGLSRALEKMNPEWRFALKKAGLLTRDSRVKERKKPGQPGARKRFQFSKR